MSLTMTFAPSAANSSAIALPMPRPAPVIRATSPCRRIVSLPCDRWRFRAHSVVLSMMRRGHSARPKTAVVPLRGNGRITMRCVASLVVMMLWVAGLVTPARAETGEMRIAIQDGLAYLPFIIMDNEKLVEKHAKAAGVPELKVTWQRLANSVIMN